MKLNELIQENQKHREDVVQRKLEELVESMQSVLDRVCDEVIHTEHQFRMSVEPELADRVRPVPAPPVTIGRSLWAFARVTPALPLMLRRVEALRLTVTLSAFFGVVTRRTELCWIRRIATAASTS